MIKTKNFLINHKDIKQAIKINKGKNYYKAEKAINIYPNTGYCRYEVGGGLKNKKSRQMPKRINLVIQKHNVIF